MTRLLICIAFFSRKEIKIVHELHLKTSFRMKNMYATVIRIKQGRVKHYIVVTPSDLQIKRS